MALARSSLHFEGEVTSEGPLLAHIILLTQHLALGIGGSDCIEGLGRGVCVVYTGLVATDGHLNMLGMVLCTFADLARTAA